MSIAYVDTSCLVAIAFDEPSAAGVKKKLRQHTQLLSASFLEAELLSAFRREGRLDEDDFRSAVQLVAPDRPLTGELRRVLAAGYLRGGDCWHLATALYLSPDPEELIFITLDSAQREVARTLGFRL